MDINFRLVIVVGIGSTGSISTNQIRYLDSGLIHYRKAIWPYIRPKLHTITFALGNSTAGKDNIWPESEKQMCNYLKNFTKTIIWEFKKLGKILVILMFE